MRTFRLVCSAILLLAALPACDSPVTPAAVAGTYVLESIGRTPLPAVLPSWSPTRTVVVADTLRLGAGSEGSRVTVQRPESAAPRIAADTVRSPLGYRVRSGRIEITFLCAEPALCSMVEGPHMVGRLTSGGVVFGSGDEALSYRRVD
jgi:hypothetical protein